MRSAIFDLDGTLADTSADLIAAANGGFAVAPLDPVADARLAFRGGRAMLAEGFARQGLEAARIAAEVEAAFPALLERYNAALVVETRLYDGVVEALDALEAGGWRLGVCTNKPVEMAEAVLQALGVRHRFLAVLGAGSLSVRKPDPLHLTETIVRVGGTVDRAVLVGDTETDLNAARAAGVPCVLVGFGPDGDGVRDMGPDAVLAHYRDLPGVLERLRS